jgi:hypothetical protein
VIPGISEMEQSMGLEAKRVRAQTIYEESAKWCEQTRGFEGQELQVALLHHEVKVDPELQLLVEEFHIAVMRNSSPR